MRCLDNFEVPFGNCSLEIRVITLNKKTEFIPVVSKWHVFEKKPNLDTSLYVKVPIIFVFIVSPAMLIVTVCVFKVGDILVQGN
jgi:hypothetical protein